MPHKDPVVRAAYLREWKAAHRGRYADRQKAIDAARHANGRAERYGVPGRITIDEAAAILAVEVCHWCRGTDPRPWWGLDHVVGLGQPGSTNWIESVVCSCHSCNLSKGTNDRPGRWSRTRDECVDCGTTERRHSCHGRCNRCDIRSRKDHAPLAPSRLRV